MRCVTTGLLCLTACGLGTVGSQPEAPEHGLDGGKVRWDGGGGPRDGGAPHPLDAGGSPIPDAGTVGPVCADLPGLGDTASQVSVVEADASSTCTDLLV